MTDFLPPIDTPGDWLRLLIFAVCSACLALLAQRFITRHGKWNAKTRDYWFAMLTWSVAGAVIGIQGIQEGLPISSRTILVTFAACVTLRGLSRSGGWGDDD